MTSIINFNFKNWALILLIAVFVIINLELLSFRYVFGFVLFVFLIYIYSNPIKRTINDIRPIKNYLFYYLCVILISFISIYFAFDAIQTIKEIIKFLIFPLILLVFSYLVIKNTNIKYLNIAIVIIFCIIVLHPSYALYKAIIYYFSNNEFINIKITSFDNVIIIWTMFLSLSFALGLSLLLNKKSKILGILIICLSIATMIANGTRTQIFAALIMLFAFIFIPKYKYKKIIILIFSFIILAATLSFYTLSGNLKNNRYNFKHLIQNSITILDAAPAKMGQFDIFCFKINNSYKCSEHNNKQSSLIYDSSALQRLSLAKSAILAILDNPIRPNGFYARYFDYNLANIFPDNSINLPYVTILYKENMPHTHMHNQILSFIFELGIFGFIFIAFSFVFALKLILKKYYELESSMSKTYLLTILLFLFGFMPLMMLDSPLSFTNYTSIFFILLGISLGVSTRDKYDNNI